MLDDSRAKVKQLEGRNLLYTQLQPQMCNLRENFDKEKQAAIKLTSLNDVRCKHTILLSKIKLYITKCDSSNDNLTSNEIDSKAQLKVQFEQLLLNAKQRDNQLRHLNVLYITFDYDMNAIETKTKNIANAIEEERFKTNCAYLTVQ